MAIKSILDIEVNDSAFQRFREHFDKYQSALADMPDAWRAVGGEIDGASAGFAKMTAALMAQNELLHSANKEQDRARETTERQVRAWHSMAKDAHAFASRIADATKSLLRWTGITTALSGILGVGGLFGIDRLAIAAGQGRRSALGLGLTFGEQRAFQTDFGRIVDPGAFLGGVNEALHDVTKRVALMSLGLNPEEGADTAQVGAEALMRVKRLMDQTPDNMLAQVAQARHLGDLGLSLQDLERIKATPAAELGAYASSFQTDVARLNLTRQQLKAWQDLQVQLHRAGQSIEVTLIRGLTPLAQPLEKLSQGFADIVAALANSPTVKLWVEELGHGLEDVAKWIGSPQFKSDVESFVEDIGKLAKAIEHAVEWVEGLLPGGAKAAPSSSKGPTEQQKAAQDFARNNKRLEQEGLIPYLWDWATGNLDQPPGTQPPARKQDAPVWYEPWTWRWEWHDWSKRPAHPTDPVLRGIFGSLEQQQHLPPGLLNSVFQTESGGDPNAIGPMTRYGQAKGGFQFTDDTARRYGLQNQFDPAASAYAASRYFRDLLDEFHGDVEEALAGYNWGPANVARDIAQYGSDWKAHAPRETQNYVTNVLAGMSAPAAPGFASPQQGRIPGVRIEVNNNTGGNATVSASQLATR